MIDGIEAGRYRWTRIFMLDSEGRIASWNVGAKRIYRYGDEEIIGAPFSSFYLPESVRSGTAERDLAKAKYLGRHESEGGRVRKDGSNFWATVIIASLRDEAGRHLGYATATRDMTERLRAEQERVRLTRIEEDEHRKNEFLAIMGHELRNPLAPMVTAMQLIKLRGGQDCEKEFAVLDRQIHHMKHLVDDLINLSRTLRGQFDLDPTVIEIGQVLANAIEVAQPLIQKRHHQLKVNADTKGRGSRGLSAASADSESVWRSRAAWWTPIEARSPSRARDRGAAVASP